jgi:nucleoside-diphosphate-sugar epimerase
MFRRIPDISKIRDLIDFEPKTSLDEALELIIRYEKKKADG